MSGIKDQERIEAVRRRLYERGRQDASPRSHDLHDIKEPIRTTWEKPPQQISHVPPEVSPQEVQQSKTNAMSYAKRNKGYRFKIVVAGIIFFILAVGASSLYLMFGKTGISGNNISIAVTGPFTVGGGQTLKMQVGITNDNEVPIEAATLVVQYPDGTQSVATGTNQAHLLNTERLPLQTINAGETVNVPMQAVVYGQENQEETIQVSIEYRVQNSNATFYKEATPLQFKITSSPVVVHADTLKKISSGQEADVTVSVTSNSPTPLSQILVAANYPSGFSFSSSDPSPTHDQDQWLIQDLEPGATKTITIKGVVVGKESDVNVINFTVGVPSEQDPQSMSSIFQKAQTQFQIEQPFLNVSMKINNDSDSEVLVQPGKRANVEIALTNTLDDSLYDASITVQLSGNAFSVDEVGPSSGFFDQSKNTITWDVSNTPALHQIDPGETKTLTFSVEPSAGVAQTPQVNIAINASGHRVSESNVSEQLIGTAKGDIKVVSIPQIRTVVNHGNGIFNDTGPVPPISDQTTTYTVSMVLTDGSNDIGSAVVDATLPAYMTWLNKIDGNSKITFDPTTRTVEWSPGDVSANSQAYVSFQVSLLPHSLQVGTVPVVLGSQQVQAVDKFTGSVVHATGDAVTTRLASDMGQTDTTGTVGAATGN